MSLIPHLGLPVFCFLLVFYLGGVYDFRPRSAEELDRMIGRAFALTVLVLALLFGAVPSLRPADHGILTLFVVLFSASLLHFPLHWYMEAALDRSVLVLGTNAVAIAAAHEFDIRGYEVLGFVGSNRDGTPGRLLSTLTRSPEVLAETRPGRIIVALRSPSEELPIRELLEQRLRGVPVETAHEAYERLTGKIFLDDKTAIHLLVSRACLSRRLYQRMKRVTSAALAALALVPALPVMALIALAIRAGDKGPVLFVQERIGLNGRPFRLFKFRSMRVEKKTSSEWECDNEDRITSLGHWLRKLHLDELPQLWNILRGDMDLVGPRPHPVSNYELFTRSIPYYSLRSLVRPGLTGWAQVRNGYAQDLPGEIEKMRYDLCAIARPSLRRDLGVLLATARITLLGRPVEPEMAGVRSRRERPATPAVPVHAAPQHDLSPDLDAKFARVLLSYRTVDPSVRRHTWRPGSVSEARGNIERPPTTRTEPPY